MADFVVCLDPGHDSEFYNPSPVNGKYFEGERMWALARILSEKLRSRGIGVRVTKDRVNQVISLTDRGKMSAGADLFVSLHSNAAATEGPDWVVIMHQVKNDGDADEKSKSFAEAIGPAVGEVMGVSCELRGEKSSKDRDGDGYPDDYYGVLRGASSVGTPGVIIEHGFHINPRCADWLLHEVNLEKLAQREAEVIEAWLRAERPEVWYRVRKNWQDAAGQLGAFRSFAYAVAACPAGYYVFDEKGNALYPQMQPLEAFIRQVQGAIGVKADGKAGTETLGKTPTVSRWKNRKHPVVEVLQKRFWDLGYTQVGEADGVAGPKFDKAVREYQKDHGCTVDGKITGGKRTWKTLLGMR